MKTINFPNLFFISALILNFAGEILIHNSQFAIHNSMRKWFFAFLWTLLFVCVVAVVGIFWAIADGRIGYMPPIADLQNPINKYASQVFSADGKLLGTWNRDRENRVMVDYSDLSPLLVQALVDCLQPCI